jgi:glycosyltransferase involved in cell wall biosynthesis
MFIRSLAREADGLIVSTPPLAERMARLNPRVVVVPNLLDERLFGEGELGPAKLGGPTLIGYMGTFSHDADLMMILQALRAVLRRHAGRVALQIVGGLADPAARRALDGLPVQVLDASRHVAYPDFVRWMRRTLRWDVAIAPLEDNPFTRCKSDIKFLDYSALGFAGVYSRALAYADAVRQEETGSLAEDAPEAWEAALEALLNDPAARERLAANARQSMWPARTLQQGAPLWAQAIQRTLGVAAEATT